MGQKIPDQSPEAIGAIFREHYGMDYTPDNIFAFVNAITEHLDEEYSPPSEEDTKAVALFLVELIQAAHSGKPWEPYKKKIGVRKLIFKKPFDPKLATTHDSEFMIVLESLKPGGKYDVAILELMELHGVSEGTAKGWYRSMKPNAEKTLRSTYGQLPHD